MPEGPESGLEEDVYTYIYLYDVACIGNPSFTLEFCYAHSIVHNKACIRMVT
jgi:hypothetical protein